MKTEFLKNLGDFMTDEIINRIMEENGKDVEKLKKQNENLTAEIGTLKNSYSEVETKLKAFDGINIEELRGQISTLTKSISDTKSEWEKKYNDREFQYNLNEFIKGKKFKYPEFEDYYANKISYALADEKNKGKNFDDLLNEFVKDKDGNPRSDLFAEEKAPEQNNPHQVTFPKNPMPAAGKAPVTTKINPFAKDTYDVKEQIRIYKENPVNARELAKTAGVTLPD